MLDFLSDNMGVLALLLLIMWGLQFAFTYVQMRKFYARLKIVRQAGLTAVGKGGGQYRGRVYGVLTVDENKTIIHAEKMSGWSNFSGLKAVPELIGLSLHDILDETRELPVSRKLSEAFRDAAAYLLDAKPSQTLPEADPGK
ncbi:MAG: hypothetical protein KJZ53_02625 [Anaerolineales bacterium]|nr:hypothetical protein [Anaerolineales bacterium]MCL4257406.1 hypothetical protein [Anaerolineales bacterium]QYK51448.1 MAG: hypothetical protein KF701_02880 [Anaerolineales bacterium]